MNIERKAAARVSYTYIYWICCSSYIQVPNDASYSIRRLEIEGTEIVNTTMAKGHFANAKKKNHQSSKWSQSTTD